MSFSSTLNTRIIVGTVHLSSKLESISAPWTTEMLAPTTFTDSTKRALPGLSGSSLSIGGFVETTSTVNSSLTGWTTNRAIAYAPIGFTAGNYVILADAIKGDYEVGTEVAGLSTFTLGATTDGFTDWGVSLHDIVAATVDENGGAVDGTAATTNGGLAQLHITAFSGLTNAVVTVEDSSTGSSGWATIATFATATAVTSERVTIAGNIKRYTRYVLDVTGTGSVTFQVSLARR